MPVGRLFLLRDDPSMRRRSNGSNVPLNTALALSGVRYFVEAVPSGRVLLQGDTKPHRSGFQLCPYNLTVPRLNSYAAELFQFGQPLFENAYQAAKFCVWSPRHSQMLNGKVAFRTEGFECPGELMRGGVRIDALRGREVWEAEGDRMKAVLESHVPIRSKFPKHMRKCIVGAINWKDISGPLLNYQEGRRHYGDMFTDCVQHNSPSMALLHKIRTTLEAGSDVIIAETDGPHLSAQEEYAQQGLDFSLNTGLLHLTEEAFRFAYRDVEHIFGHGYWLAAQVLSLPTPAAQPHAQLSQRTLQKARDDARQTDDRFRLAKNAKAAETRASKRARLQ